MRIVCIAKSVTSGWRLWTLLSFEDLGLRTLLFNAFLAFSGAMDSFARWLKNAAKLIEDGKLSALVKVSIQCTESSHQLVDVYYYLFHTIKCRVASRISHIHHHQKCPKIAPFPTTALSDSVEPWTCIPGVAKWVQSSPASVRIFPVSRKRACNLALQLT